MQRLEPGHDILTRPKEKCESETPPCLPGFPVFCQFWFVLIARYAVQDELYLQYLTDACLDAVRGLLGPRRALLWIRSALLSFRVSSAGETPQRLAFAAKAVCRLMRRAFVFALQDQMQSLCREIRLFSELLYHGLTTGAGLQTLGEEYCDILQVSGRHCSLGHADLSALLGPMPAPTGKSARASVWTCRICCLPYLTVLPHIPGSGSVGSPGSQCRLRQGIRPLHTLNVPSSLLLYAVMLLSPSGQLCSVSGHETRMGQLAALLVGVRACMWAQAPLELLLAQCAGVCWCCCKRLRPILLSTYRPHVWPSTRIHNRTLLDWKTLHLPLKGALMHSPLQVGPCPSRACCHAKNSPT